MTKRPLHGTPPRRPRIGQAAGHNYYFGVKGIRQPSQSLPGRRSTYSDDPDGQRVALSSQGKHGPGIRGWKGSSKAQVRLSHGRTGCNGFDMAGAPTYARQRGFVVVSVGRGEVTNVPGHIPVAHDGLPRKDEAAPDSGSKCGQQGTPSPG